MKGKKGLFGYRFGLKSNLSSPGSEWFDPSAFLVRGEETLTEEETEKPQLLLPKIVTLIAVAILGFRLTHLQIAQGNENRYLAEGNRIRRQILPAPRGAIVDRSGKELVVNEPGYSLDIIPSDLPRKKDDRHVVLQRVADEHKVPLETIAKLVDKAGLSSLDPVSVASNLPREQALIYKVKFATTPGVRVSYSPTRRYELTPGLAHLLGYTSLLTEDDLKKHPDYQRSALIGRSGIESSYDLDLRGEVGISEVEVNATGQFQRALRNTPPQVGKTLRLTLDNGLQAEMAAALEEAMSKNGGQTSGGCGYGSEDRRNSSFGFLAGLR